MLPFLPCGWLTDSDMARGIMSSSHRLDGVTTTPNYEQPASSTMRSGHGNEQDSLLDIEESNAGSEQTAMHASIYTQPHPSLDE